ncbi:MAG TPA: Holliday junction branch migration protein RuvA [Terriglobia bacterium]|nr:Holliday junction branch migration protein RuvA [Terriglobia bacterium]
MIAHLRGKLIEKAPSRLVVEANGVGYEVFVSMSTFTAMPVDGVEVSLDIHTHVREDILALYGFFSKQERAVFERLIGVSGIGPRLAMTILSGGSVEGLVGAIRKGDLARLTAIPGVGKKTAERIVVELRDKLAEFAEGPAKSTVEMDVLSALENLGYPHPVGEAAIRRAMEGETDVAFDVLFKRSLQILTKG